MSYISNFYSTFLDFNDLRCRWLGVIVTWSSTLSGLTDPGFNLLFSNLFRGHNGLFSREEMLPWPQFDFDEFRHDYYIWMKTRLMTSSKYLSSLSSDNLLRRIGSAGCTNLYILYFLAETSLPTLAICRNSLHGDQWILQSDFCSSHDYLPVKRTPMMINTTKEIAPVIVQIELNLAWPLDEESRKVGHDKYPNPSPRILMIINILMNSPSDII